MFFLLPLIISATLGTWVAISVLDMDGHELVTTFLVELQRSKETARQQRRDRETERLFFCYSGFGAWEGGSLNQAAAGRLSLQLRYALDVTPIASVRRSGQ